MRKIVLTIAVLCFMAASLQIFAVSYDDNSFQRKSREYSALASSSYEEGDYDMAVEYANEAEKNARLSEEYIKKMLLRSEAETEMNRARTRLTWAREIKADVNYPSEFTAAAKNVDSGSRAFNNEDYESAKRYAGLALECLEGIGEGGAGGSVVAETEPSSSTGDGGKVPLPAQYKVGTWNPDRDCFWNIAGNEAVYGDSFKWKKLYNANKDLLPDPSNPDLILPNTVLEIPSLSGEQREGLYNPNADYGSIKDR